MSVCVWMLTVCSERRMNLIPIGKNDSGPLQYEFNVEKSVLLPGAHGEELVRDVFTDIHVSQVTTMNLRFVNVIQTRTTFTCGEDSYIRAWKAAGDESMDVDEEAEPAKKSKDRKEKRKEKKEKKRGDEKEKARFKPY